MENLPPAPTTAKPDVTGATALIGTITAAAQDANTISGTLDATKLDATLGAFPSNAPTEAAEPPVTITISGYGTTDAPSVPAGATGLDPAAYEMLTNDVD